MLSLLALHGVLLKPNVSIVGGRRGFLFGGGSDWASKVAHASHPMTFFLKSAKSFPGSLILLRAGIFLYPVLVVSRKARSNDS